MKLIVGLGNPGPSYARTRHNVGFRIVERFATRHGIALASRRFAGRFGCGPARGGEVAILAPETYMNRSGGAVREATRALGIDDLARDLLVVMDDVDLPFGRLRIRRAGGAGGHRGLADLIERLGCRDFARLRFGIGRPPPGIDTTDHVLAPFECEEEQALDARIEEAVDALEAILADGVAAAMNRYNAPADAVPPDP